MNPSEPVPIPKTAQQIADEKASRLRRERLEAAIGGFIYCLRHDASRLHVTDLDEVIYKHAVPRRVGRRSIATVTIRTTPEMLARIQHADAAERFRFLLVAIPEEAIERVASPIVLPG